MPVSSYTPEEYISLYREMSVSPEDIAQMGMGEFTSFYNRFLTGEISMSSGSYSYYRELYIDTGITEYLEKMLEKVNEVD